MTHSLIGADRSTHLKIVVVALVASILVVVVGVSAHVTDNSATARLQTNGPILKAGKNPAFSTRDDAAIR